MPERRRREPSRRAGWLIVTGFLLGLLAVIGLQLQDVAGGSPQPAPAVTRTRTVVSPGPTVTITPGPQYTITFTPAAGNG